MIIDITNQQTKIPLRPPRIVEITKRILKYQRIRHASLSLAFVADPRIKALNQKYLGHNYATDVLAFDLNPVQDKKQRQTNVINGEIVISATAACRNSKRFGTTADQEIVLYIIHGILHLSGYDDRDPGDVAIMRKREGQILNDLVKSSPSRMLL